MNIFKISLIFFLFLLTACANDEEYICGGTGLLLSSNRASFGEATLQFCKKRGVVSEYHTDCNSKEGYFLYFDTVSYEVLTFYGNSTAPIKRTQCTKKKQ